MTTRKQSVDQQKNKLTKGKEKHANMQLREAFIVGKQEKCVMFLVSKAINFCTLWTQQLQSFVQQQIFSEATNGRCSHTDGLSSELTLCWQSL